MSKEDVKQEVADQKKKSKKPSKEKAQKEQQDRLEELQGQMQEEQDRYLRLFAEFENYKRRTGKERVELFKTASQDVMVSLLPILDDFDRALKEMENMEVDHLQGVQLIANKLRETLKQKGLEVIDTKKGDTFNADHHEAVTQIPAPSEDLKGQIIDVIEKGYVLGEKIIRYPKVVIGQ